MLTPNQGLDARVRPRTNEFRQNICIEQHLTGARGSMSPCDLSDR